MDNRKLAEQLAKTGNLMDLCHDEAWIKEAARIEEKCNGQVEAGLVVQHYATAKYDDSRNDVRQASRQQMRIQSILFSELQQWIQEWNIGLSFEETYTKARELVRRHLKNPDPELQNWLQSLLTEDTQVQEINNMPIRTQTRDKLAQMLTEEDWIVLAKAAAKSISAGVLQLGQTKQQTITAA